MPPNLIYTVSQFNHSKWINMKKRNLFTALVCLVSLLSFSQLMNNRVNTMQNDVGTNYEPSKEEIEKAREENLNKLMTQLTEDLTLDALQVVAIRQIYAESVKKQGIILKKEDSNEAKLEALKSLNDSTESKVLALLNPQQKEKFELIKSEAVNSKNKKKAKKKTKNE